MKKQAVLRGLLGFPLGVFLGYAITIGVSLFHGDGGYAPVVPALIEEVGSELNAVMVQFLLTGLLGAGCAACSVIWAMERWSIVKQSGVYFLLLALLMLPTAYLCHWMDRSFWGIVGYLMVFVGIYLAVWLIQYWVCKRKVKAINRKLPKD